MTAQVYSGLQGNAYSAGREIGRGGEGAVFEVRENPALVLKVYTAAPDADKVEKLRYMAGLHDEELSRFAAWPLDVLRNSAGQVCGFVMKKLDGFVPLHMLFSPVDRKRRFPDKGYNFLVHVARNLATAFGRLHQSGIVMGDVNEANVLVSANGMVSLIDCDSFQVKNGSRYHYCEVGIPRYTPPELLERGSFNEVVRTADTDSFSLATLIFQLLFLGRPPFTGVNFGTEDIDEEKAIRTREFAYSLRRPRKKLHPAKNSFELQNLTPGVIDLCHHAFEGSGERPTPQQWVAALDALGKELVTCPQSKLHVYPRHLRQCPWCRFKDRAGIAYFLDDAYLREVAELNDIDRFVNGFKLDQITLKKLPAYYGNYNIQAAPISSKYRHLLIVNQAILFLASGVVFWMWFHYGIIYMLIGFFAVVILKIISPLGKMLNQELQRRRDLFLLLETQFNTLVQQHNEPADLMKYTHASAELTRLIKEFKGLPTEFTAKKRKAEQMQQQAQYYKFLQQFNIEAFTIPQFGPAKKQLLEKNGIRTAADILKLAHTKIPGIGDANLRILQEWQRQMGSGFTYVPNLTDLNKDLLIARNEIAQKKRRLEDELRNTYKGLHYLKNNITVSVTALERQYHALAERTHQASLDYEAFKDMVK